jgi:hypothetical protein
MPDRSGIDVPSRHIYHLNGGEYDHTRWLTIAHRGPETCVLHLTDLCQPGMVSQFNSVTCPTSYLRESVERGGSLQLTFSTGFLLLQRLDESVRLEFRGADDSAAIKATFRVEDILTNISSLQNAGKFAVTV